MFLGQALLNTLLLSYLGAAFGFAIGQRIAADQASGALLERDGFDAYALQGGAFPGVGGGRNQKNRASDAGQGDVVRHDVFSVGEGKRCDGPGWAITGPPDGVTGLRWGC